MFLHGGDYNPEQWKSDFKLIESDLKKLKAANINTVTIGMFNWANLEPSEGVYDFDWYIKVLDLLNQYQFKVIIGTPTAARPHWLAQNHPQTSRVDVEGKRELSGFRHNHCMQSSEFREYAEVIIRKVCSIASKYDNVHSWHINNELAGHCYCELCQAKFREYLKDEYGTINNLNSSWWNDFWSHNYASFEEVIAPLKHGENSNTSLHVNWEQFKTVNHIDYFNFEKEIITEYSSLPITTNFYEDPFSLTIDYHKFADVVDYISYDTYPAWNTSDNYDVAINSLMDLKMVANTDSAKEFYIMESSPGSTNWLDYTTIKSGELHAASTYLQLFANSRSFLYFQLKQSLGSTEKYHGAVLDRLSDTDARVYNYVKEFGKQTKELSMFANAHTTKQVGIYYDWNNTTMLKYSDGPRNKGYNERELYSNIFEYFINTGCNVDFFYDAKNINDFDIVIFPYAYNVKNQIIETIKKSSSKTVIAFPMFNYVDSNDVLKTTESPSGLTTEFGIKVTEVYALLDGCNLIFDSVEFKDIVEVIKVEDAKIIVNGDISLHESAITEKEYKTNKYIYFSGVPTQESLSSQFDRILGLNYTEGKKVITQKVILEEKPYNYLINFGNNSIPVSDVIWSSKPNINTLEPNEFAIQELTVESKV